MAGAVDHDAGKRLKGVHKSCGEGACSRWAAKRPRDRDSAVCESAPLNGFATAAQPSGSKLPRHIVGMNQRIIIGCRAAIASKLAPTVDPGMTARGWSAVRPPSSERRPDQARSHRRAKAERRTPRFHHSSGRALARLQLLILIHPPPRKAEWRCLSGDWRAAPFDAVELIACRSKRSRPEGNAPG